MKISRIPSAAALAATVLAGCGALTLGTAPAANAARDDGGSVDGVAVTYVPAGLHKAGHDLYVDNDVVGSITRRYAAAGATAEVTVYRSDVGRTLANLRGWTSDDMPAATSTTVHGKAAYQGVQNGKNDGIIWIERAGVGVNIQVSKNLGYPELHKIADGVRADS
jgi:hypothetical protein